MSESSHCGCDCHRRGVLKRPCANDAGKALRSLARWARKIAPHWRGRKVVWITRQDVASEAMRREKRLRRGK